MEKENSTSDADFTDLGMPLQFSQVAVEAAVSAQELKDGTRELDDNQNTAKNPISDNEVTPSDLMKTYYFGCGPVHFEWMQVFANKKFFTFIMCLYTLMQGVTISGINSVNISSLEKRYSFSSTLAGLLNGTYELTIVIGVIFVSYIGGKTHKPRFLGISLMILGVGNFVMASPQFFFGSYKQGSASQSNYEECMSMGPADDDCSAANIGAYVILLIAQVILGIGASATYTIALAYIDEIVYPRFVSLHLGVNAVSGIVGPAIGYLLGSLLLTIYVDPWIETDLTNTDPNWVGAWWIGLLIMGCSCLLVSSIFLMFPKWLPDSHLVRKERAKEMAKTYSSKFANEDTLTLAVKEFPVHIKQLLTNASFMFTAFALAAIFVILEGVILFGPKYMETMFSITATTAGLLSGGVGIGAAVIGVGTGALIIYFWKPKGRKTTVVQFIVICASIPFVAMFLIKCPSNNVAGIVVPYADGSFDGKDSSLCSMNCSCVSSVYEPVCGSDGITYFSPCRAGCTNSSELNDDGYTFQDCSCIAQSLLISNLSHVRNDSSTEGVCPNDCNLLWLFVLIVFVLVLLLLSIEIPYYHYTLRVVADDQRHLALGLQSAIYRVFGSIPGPLLFGAVIDLACVEWENNCGIRGNCWVYDNDRLSLYLILLCIPFCIVSATLFLFAMITYPKKTVAECIGVETVETPS